MKRTHLKRPIVLAAITAFTALTLIACGSDSGSGDAPSMGEIAIATVSGNVSAATNGAQALMEAKLGNKRCPTVTTGTEGQNCSIDGTGKTMTLAYDSCNFGNNSAVWDGSQVLTSSATVSCGVAPSEAEGATLLRTFGKGTTRTIGNSVHVSTLDTTQASGYETEVSGGTLITYGSDGARTIEIKGVHVLSQKIFRGNGNEGRVETEADHTVSTAAEHPLTVSVESGNRVVNGTLEVQHNVEHYTGSAVFEDVTYSPSADCCLPISGKVVLTLRGSKEGSETLEFTGSECGTAKFKTGEKDAVNVVLSRCF